MILTNREQHRKERISGTEDKIGEMDTLVKKKKVKPKRKNLGPKSSGKLGHCKNTKSMSNRNRGNRRNSNQKAQKIFNKIIGKIFLT